MILVTSYLLMLCSRDIFADIPMSCISTVSIFIITGSVTLCPAVSFSSFYYFLAREFSVKKLIFVIIAIFNRISLSSVS